MNAFEQYQKITDETKDPRTVTRNVEEKHYLITFGDEVPHREVPGGVIQRGEVTPILRMPVWDKTDDVPEELRISLRSNGTEAKYFLPPEPIFRGVMKEYESWGVTDLTAVTDGDPQKVWDLQITQTFFPSGVPETYDAIEAALRSATLPTQHRPIWEGLQKDLLRAVQNARRADTALVDETEANIEKSKTQPGYASTYTDPALRAMKRLNRERKDFAITQVATRQNQIVDALPQMIEKIAVQQGTSLSPEHLMEFAKVLGQQLTEGVKEAISAAAPVKAAPPVTQQSQQKR